MDWVSAARKVFHAEPPAHFTNHLHCEECAEHDNILRSHDIDSIGLAELGNPAWDPLSFSSAAGIKYYLPAMIRISLATMHDQFYLEQLLFHLHGNGKDDNLRQSCSVRQRRFVGEFLAHPVTDYPQLLDNNGCQDEVLHVLDLWSDD